MNSRMAPLFLLLLSSSTVLGCFLNSCPYRRYGRSGAAIPTVCTECGENNTGICTALYRCCTLSSCSVDVQCGERAVCAKNTCKIKDAVGSCKSQGVCCTDHDCLMSMQCF